MANFKKWSIQEGEEVEQHMHSRPEILKKFRPKKVVKPNKTISQVFLGQIQFFAILKMAKIQFLNWEKV